MHDAEPIFTPEPEPEPALPIAVEAPPSVPVDPWTDCELHNAAHKALSNASNLQQVQDALGALLGVPLRLAEAGPQVLAYFELAGAPPKYGDPLARFFDGWSEDHAVQSFTQIYIGPLHYFGHPGAPRILGTMPAFERVRKLRREAPQKAIAEGRAIVTYTLECLREQVEQARAQMRPLVD